MSSSNSSRDHSVSIWTPHEDSRQLHEIYQSTIGSIPPYSLPAKKFHSLITATRATVFTVTSSHNADDVPRISGFALTYLIRAGSAQTPSMQHDKGSIALLAVLPTSQNKGIGSSLHSAALKYLTERVQSSLSLSTPPAPSSEIQIGTIFPRIFPGIPAGEEFKGVKGWFEKRGWVFKDEQSIDLYRTVGDLEKLRVELKPVGKRAVEAGWTFRSPKESDDEALLALQEAEFGRFTGWPDIFPRLLTLGQREEIWCAFDPSGVLKGATLAAMPGSAVHEVLAWPYTLGSACGSIACVGMSASSQGSGAGIAMVASAFENLASRGADGCFVDWVSLKGFYEKCGFEKWASGYYESWRTVTPP